MKNLQVSITPEDIQRGSKKDVLRCPIALAIRREHCGKFNCFDYAVVGDRFVSVREVDGMYYTFAQSPEMKEWRRSFDTGEQVAPTTFTIELVLQGALA